MCLLKTLKQSCPFLLLENSDKHMKYLTKFQKDLHNNSPLWGYRLPSKIKWFNKINLSQAELIWVKMSTPVHTSGGQYFHKIV